MWDNASKIMIDGEELWVNNLWSNGYSGDTAGSIELSLAQIEKSLKPIAKIGKVIGEKAKELCPDETELTIDLTMGIENGKIIFGIGNYKAEAGISLRFLWNKENNVNE